MEDKEKNNVLNGSEEKKPEQTEEVKNLVFNENLKEEFKENFNKNLFGAGENIFDDEEKKNKEEENGKEKKKEKNIFEDEEEEKMDISKFEKEIDKEKIENKEHDGIDNRSQLEHTTISRAKLKKKNRKKRTNRRS